MRWKHVGRDILHWPDGIAAPADIPLAHGGNPVLFPFAARCFVEGAAYWWKTPSGELRPMPMHGLARQGKFALVRVDASGFEAEFCPDECAREAYPFDYRFSVIYRFFSGGFTCRFDLENRGNSAIPWSAGHHFYFRVPLAGEVPLAAHRFHCDAAKAYLVGPATAGTICPEPVFPRRESLANTRLANAVIHCGLLSGRARITANGDTELSLDMGPPRPGFAFVTWSPDLSGPFYCVEPWMGPSNAPEHGIGLHFVEPGTADSFEVAVKYRFASSVPAEDHFPNKTPFAP